MPYRCGACLIHRALKIKGAEAPDWYHVSLQESEGNVIFDVHIWWRRRDGDDDTLFFASEVSDSLRAHQWDARILGESLKKKPKMEEYIISRCSRSGCQSLSRHLFAPMLCLSTQTVFFCFFIFLFFFTMPSRKTSFPEGESASLCQRYSTAPP